MIIGLTGRIASGKGVVAEFLKSKFEYTTTSSVIRAEAEKFGILDTRGNLQDLGNKVRKEEGGGAWMKRLIQYVDLTKGYVVDGIRNPGEIEELRNLSSFYLIAVDAPRKLRYRRFIERDKEGDRLDWESFLKADERDFGINEPSYGQQVMKCMKMADYLILNSGNLELFKRRIKKVYDEISLMEGLESKNI